MTGHETTVKIYRGADIEVTFEPGRCVHFAECVRGLPQVFDVSRRPWITPDADRAEVVADVVRRCPSGALHTRTRGTDDEEPERPTRVTVRPDGPLLLRGDLRIDLTGGGSPDTTAETRLALCRCGRTGREPLCDGSCPDRQ